MDIGYRIKQLRTKNNLTLEELASRCELTKGFLSQLERNLTSPSIATLQDIVEALGTTLAKFFQEETEEKLVFTDDDYFVDEREDCTIHWIVPNAQKNEMEPILLELPPQGQSHEVVVHEGEEFGYVLHGQVNLVAGRRTYRVRKGFSFCLHPNTTHYLENTGAHPAVILWISTPPSF